MKHPHIRLILSITVLLGLMSAGKADDAATDKAILKVLDDFMAAFNAQDRKKAHATFHFPHARIAGGEVRVWETPGDLEENPPDDGKLAKKIGWHHSVWDSRKVIQRSENQVHVAVQYTRFDKDGKKIHTVDAIYVMTKKDSRWGIKARCSLSP